MQRYSHGTKNQGRRSGNGLAPNAMLRGRGKDNKMKKKKRLNPVGVDAVVMHAMGIYYPDGHVRMKMKLRIAKRMATHVSRII